MKKILGLDLGTSSIGWEIVNEAEKSNENSQIVRLGVRVNPLTTDELSNFEKGKSITTNSERTLKRSIRRYLQRYKNRRAMLIDILVRNKFLYDNSILSESGNNSTFETYSLRAKSATEKVSLYDFARILLQINKKRGYKSNRKVKTSEEGQLIDTIDVAERLYNDNLTPGQLSLMLLEEGKKYLPEFYRSDLQDEFNKIWNFQKQFYPELLVEQLFSELKGKNRSQTGAICLKLFNIDGIKRQTKGFDLKLENYRWRSNALKEKVDLEVLTIIFQELNSQINNASGYLGDISDRSKVLYLNNQTVGQYQMSELERNPHYSLKNQVFYRQDYINEFNKIWETQSIYHKELTSELKKEIFDAIFFQRPLKSQKGLISFCELESRKVEVEREGIKKEIIIGSRVCPKSSPLFQEFKIWQILNNVQVFSGRSKRFLLQEEKEILFEELNYKEKLSKNDVLKLLFKNYKDYDLNYELLDGNKTQSELFKAYETIIELSGYSKYDFTKMESKKVKQIVFDIFTKLGINTELLNFDSSLKGHELEHQSMYSL